MFQEVIHHTLPNKIVDYIDEPTPIDTTPIDTTPVDAIPFDNMANSQDVISLYPKVDVKLRKGKYIIKMDNDETSLESCFETALEIWYF